MISEHNAFVCYSSRDRGGVAEVVLELLRRAGVEYWVDTEEIVQDRTHDPEYLVERIAAGLEDATVVLVVLTRNFEQHGPWAWREYTRVITEQIASGRQIVVPLVFEETRILARFPPGFAADFRNGAVQGERQLLEILGRLDPVEREAGLPLPDSAASRTDAERDDLERSVLFLNLATALSQQRNFRAALPILQQSGEIPFMTPDYALEVGQVFSQAGDMAHAEQAYAVVEELRAEHGLDPDPRVRMNRAIVAIELGRLEEAVELLDDAERLFSRVGSRVPKQVVQNRGMALMRMGRFDSALAQFERARQMDEEDQLPPDPVVLGAIGGARRALEDYEGALQWLDRAADAGRALRLGPDPSIHQDRVQVFLSLDRVPDARAELDELLALLHEQGSLAPPDVAAIEGRVLLYEGKPEQALRAFDRADSSGAEQGFPSKPRYQIDRSCALLLLDRPGDALGVLAGLEASRRALGPSDLSVVYEFRGDARAALGQRALAEDEYQEAMAVREEAGLGVPLVVHQKRQKNLDLLERESAAGRWRDHLDTSLQYLRDGDRRSAALALVNAFETQSDLCEPEANVVIRALIRSALGTDADVRARVVDRARERAQVEQALGGPLAALQDFLPDSGAVPDEIEQFAEAVADLDPVSESGELQLIEALCCTWRGRRRDGLDALDAALAAGAADTDERLTRFAQLERRAIDLDVDLGVGALVQMVGRSAIGGEVARAGALAQLLADYAGFLDVALAPMDQRLVDAQLRRARGD